MCTVVVFLTQELNVEKLPRFIIYSLSLRGLRGECEITKCDRSLLEPRKVSESVFINNPHHKLFSLPTFVTTTLSNPQYSSPLHTASLCFQIPQINTMQHHIILTTNITSPTREQIDGAMQLHVVFFKDPPPVVLASFITSAY